MLDAESFDATIDINVTATEVLELARRLGWSLTTAESCTGGLVSAALTRVSGASECFHESYVTYSNEAKARLLGVPELTIVEYGAVSIETAHAMAQGAVKAASADLAMSVTGIAGPNGGTDQKPVGMVCFGLGFRTESGEVQSQANVHIFENNGRDYIREQAVRFALQWALKHLKAAT
ncbi:MAG: CinA family protein [Asticcacaulis sp.]